MALIRWNPFNEAERFNRDFNNLFTGGRQYDCGCDWTPKVDIFEEERAITLSVELPGMVKDNVTVNVEDGILTLSGERKLENEEKQDGYTRIERSYGSFERTFSLPKTVDQDNITANMESGVLKVSLPKREEALPKQIEVQVS